MADASIGFGCRVHGCEAIIVAVTGRADAPVVVHRDRVALVRDPGLHEPYHAAAMAGLAEAPAVIDAAKQAATAGATDMIRALIASTGAVAAVGVVGGNRKLPELSRILTKHALLHAAERDLFEQSIIDAAARAGLPATAVPATGTLFADASQALGVDLGALLTTLGKSVGSPWQKEHREAAAAALLALDARNSSG